MNQKGFIQIPILIIAVIVVAASAAGVGVVLHKKENSTPLVSNILQALNEGNAENFLLEPEGQNSGEESKQEEQQEEIQENKTQPKNELDLPINTTSETQQTNQVSEQQNIELEQQIDPCSGVNCSNCQYCDSGICINYCQGIDSHCGCTNCLNCNNSDGCFGDYYLDYYCSNNSCIYSTDNCSDCSCSCGGYNAEESTEKGNCEDGKDNDCDGKIDSEDSLCNSENDNCHVRSIWEQGYCTSNCKCKMGEGPCNSDYECKDGHCAQYAGERYGQLASMGVCEEVPSIKILNPIENEEWEKGKTYTIKWDYHGHLNVPLSIYLQSISFSDSSSIGITSEVLGQKGEYTWTIPDSIKAGEFWTLKISGSGISGDKVDYIKIVGKNIPTVMTYNVAESEIRSDYAVLKGTVISLNGFSYYDREDLIFWFEWGETPLLGQKTDSQHPRGNSWTLLHDSIGGLLQNTTYYFKVAIQSDDGVNYGEVKSFSTKSAFPPTVSTLSRCPMQGREFTTDIMADSDGSAAFCGHITDLGGARFFETWFEWGETISLGHETAHRINIFLEYDDPAYLGYESRFFGDRVTPESVYGSSSYYCFRVAAKNNGGVSYGEIICF